ncbi:MAG: hypothetical protein AAF236_11635, partial [Verrucomicrobiota bacterium]
MKPNNYLSITAGFFMAAAGLNIVSGYQRSIRVALDTYEHELSIQQERELVRFLAECPQAAQKQTRPFFFCLFGC